MLWSDHTTVQIILGSHGCCILRAELKLYKEFFGTFLESGLQIIFEAQSKIFNISQKKKKKKIRETSKIQEYIFVEQIFLFMF